MSTTRNILSASKNFQSKFHDTFGFALDSLDKIFRLQSSVGLSESALSALTESERRRFLAILVLVESGNTTAVGILQLLSSSVQPDVEDSRLDIRHILDIDGMHDFPGQPFFQFSDDRAVFGLLAGEFEGRRHEVLPVAGLVDDMVCLAFFSRQPLARILHHFEHVHGNRLFQQCIHAG